MKNTILFIFFIAILSSQVYGADLALSPGKLNLDEMLRDGYAQRSVKIRTESIETFEIIIDWSNTTMSEWISVDYPSGEPVELGEPLEISQENPINIVLTVEPPRDLRNGLHSGALFARSNFDTSTDLETGSTIQVAVSLGIDVEISDNEIIECRSNIGIVENIEEGDDAFFTLRVYNDGNVEFSPEVNIEIWDYLGETKHKTLNLEDFNLKPTMMDDFIVTLPVTDLQHGQYFVNVDVVECNEEATRTFDILQRGTISSNGEITKIESPIRSIVGDPVLFYVTFKNTGEKGYNAKFQGHLWYEDTIQDTTHSEELYVEAGEEVIFEVPAKTKVVGLHQFKGNVYYDKKRTFEQSATLKVFDESMRDEIGETIIKEKDYRYYYYMIFVIVILILLIIIKKKRDQLR